MPSTTASTSNTISNMNFGADGNGVDVKMFGDTASAYALWDASADNLVFSGTAGLNFGTLSSSSQTGISLSASNNTVFDVFADDNNTTLGNAVYSTIRARTMLFKDATGITLISVKGQIKCADEVDFASGVYAPVQGYFETMDDTDIQSGAKFWGVDSSLESPANGAVTVDSGGILGGLHAELTGGGQFTQSSGGILAGLYIDEQVTTGSWGYGVYVTGADKVWYSSNTISGSSAVNSMELAVTDTTTASSGYSRGIYVNATVSGTKTGSGEWNGIGSDFTISGDTPYVYGLTIWGTHSGNPTLGFVAPISIYLDDMGSACGAIVGIDVGLAGGSNSPSGRHTFMRVRNHTGAQPPESIILLEGNPTADYFLDFDQAYVPIYADTSGVPANATHKIKCRVGSTDFYLIGVADF
jgi:hypothetical protein